MSATYTFTRLLYMQHGEHSDPGRLARKLQEPFKHALKFEDKKLEKESDDLFLEMAKNAILIDFQLEFAVSPHDSMWHDPDTERMHGFPFKNPSTQITFMKSRHHGEKPNMETKGRTVDFIGRPLIRWYKSHTMEEDISPEFRGPQYSVPYPDREIHGTIPLFAMMR
jgi:hypothetical protein